MLSFIFIGGLGLLFLLIGAIIAAHKTYVDDNCGVFFGIGAFFLFATIVMGLSLINRGTRFNAIISDYNNTAALVESYEGYEFGNMSYLTTKIISINDTIAKHNAHAESLWTGLWYSKEVGALEPIVYKTPTK